jgi:hypothetical protein
VVTNRELLTTLADHVGGTLSVIDGERLDDEHAAFPGPSPQALGKVSAEANCNKAGASLAGLIPRSQERVVGFKKDMDPSAVAHHRNASCGV